MAALRFLLSPVNFLIATLCTALPVLAALPRQIGVSSDVATQNVVDACLVESKNTIRTAFEGGRCAVLLRCVLDNLPSELASGMQSGANIAALVPTILAIVGAAPLDLVQLTFTSPHRALATAIFGIGLPSGLFRQLQHKSAHLAEHRPFTPCTREYVIPFSGQKTRLSVVKTIVADLIVLGLAAVMIWRNTVVAFQTVVTWRCEYSWLLLCWPIACAVWLIIAVVLLHLMASKITIASFVDENDQSGRTRSRMDLLLTNYRTRDSTQGSRNGAVIAVTGSPQPKHGGSYNVKSAELAEGDQQFFKVTIVLRHARLWSWFESVIEALAVGIYLYATFVLTSLLFLSGQQAIIYATVMILSLSAIRIIEAI